MNDVEGLIREIADEAERTKDDPYPKDAVGVRRLRGEVLSVRLNPDEHERLTRSAREANLPASTYARGRILAEPADQADTMRLRVDDEAADVLAAAAGAVGLDVRSFVIAAALERAHAVLADRRIGRLTADEIRDIGTVLDQHPEVVERLHGPALRGSSQQKGAAL